MSKQWQGFSLLELLLALAISGLLITTLWRVLLQLQRHYHFQLAQIDLIDSQRLVNTMLQKAIATAGYMGCHQLTMKDKNLPSIYLAGNLKFSINQKIFGNAFAIRYLMAPYLQLIAMPRDDQLIVTADDQIEKYQKAVWYMDDCYQHEFFTLKDIHCNNDQCQLSLLKPLQYHYKADAYIGVVNSQIWYVAESPYQDRQGHKIRALYAKVANQQRQEIALGISKLTATINPKQSQLQLLLQMKSPLFIKGKYLQKTIKLVVNKP